MRQTADNATIRRRNSDGSARRMSGLNRARCASVNAAAWKRCRIRWHAAKCAANERALFRRRVRAGVVLQRAAMRGMLRQVPCGEEDSSSRFPRVAVFAVVVSESALRGAG